MAQQTRWYDRLAVLLAEDAAKGAAASSKKKKRAAGPVPSVEEMMRRCEEAFQELKTQKREIDDDALTRKVMQSGTLTDKVAAMALAIGDFPVQSTTELEKLVDMSGSKGRREASLALDALRDLLIDALLPSDRRLNNLKTSLDLLSDRSSASKELLGLLRFEDFLKSQVWSFMKNLERATKDELTHHKVTSMKRCADILLEKPEQERFLLSLLCSKMGDPETKAASQASHLLRKITNRHPQMRAAIVAELETSVLNPAASHAYVYEGVIFLNQTILHRGDVELANRLVDIYFALFEQNLGKIDSTAVAAKEKIKRSKNKKKKANAVENVKRQGLSSRLLAAVLTGINRALPYCDIESSSEVKVKFQERSEQLHRVVRESETFANATQALALLFRLDLDRDRYHKALNSKITDPGLVEGKKTAFLNLLYRSIKADKDRTRVAQSLKLLLNVATRSSASFAAASLFLLSNLIASKPTLLVDLLGEAPIVKEETKSQKEIKPDDDTKHQSTTTLLNIVSDSISENENDKDDEHIDENNTPKNIQVLGSKPRELTIAWELDALRTHYHPTVRAFAKAILEREFIMYSGDPLNDFSVTSFLDRFVYRNPKEMKNKDTSDSTSVFGLKGREQRLGKKTVNLMPVNSEAFHQKMSKTRPKLGDETDRFFFKYFDSLKRQGVPLAQGAAAGRDVDPEEMEDLYADALVEKLLKKSAGGLEADVDDDIVDEFSSVEGLSENEDAEDDDDFDEMALGDDAFDDDDDDDDDDEFEEGSDDDDEGRTGDLSVFADADDFAGILEGTEDVDDKWLSKYGKKRGGGAKSQPPSKKRRQS